MNVIIIYFSQTGNTEKIANRIKGGILESGNKCKLIPIKKEIKLKESELIFHLSMLEHVFLY